MGLSRAAALLAAAGLAIAGCGGVERPRAAAPAAPAALIAAPPGVQAACARTGLRVLFPVRCPARWPRGTGRNDYDFSTPPGSYLLDFANGFARRGPKVFHLLLGGQAQPYGDYDDGLRISEDSTVPVKGGGTFVNGVAPRRIGTARLASDLQARVLSEPPYPRGGIHGGHVLVLWNQDGHGYLVSLHASGMARATQVRLAVAMARSAATR